MVPRAYSGANLRNKKVPTRTKPIGTLKKTAEAEFYLENLANFLLNLSIRPAVSTNFILPVKNGWL